MPALEDLKDFNVEAATISLWVFKGPRGASTAAPIYTGYWVETTDAVKEALKDTVDHERSRIQEAIEYGLLTENNEASALLIRKDETYAGSLVDAVAGETEPKRAQNAERLRNATFYLIKMVHDQAVVYAIRRTTGEWKTKRALSARSIFFADHQLDLDERPHFDLEKTIDFFIVGEDLLILNKKNFESTLRYKAAHANDFAALQAEAEFAAVFVDMTPLVQHVGVNKVQLRRMSAVRQKAHYRSAEFMNRLRQSHARYGFTFQFDTAGRIVATTETGSQIITALLDHRLTSVFSGQVYDVPDAKLVAI